MKLNIIGQAYQARAKAIDCQECVNLYPEMQLGDSKNVMALIGTPGLKPYATLAATGNFRGLYTTSGGRLFCVVSNGFYEVSGGGAESRGSLGTVTGRCYMADNGTQVMLCDGTYGYIFDLAAETFTRLTTAEFLGGRGVVFINGRFVTVAPDGSKFQFSMSPGYDGTAWDSTDYYVAEGSPDGLLSVVTSKNELWLIGTQTSEAWYMTGDSTDPFARIHGALNNIGTAAADSVATNGNTVFWLGSNAAGEGIVWAATGYTPERISTHGIEHIVSGLSRVDDAVGYCYQQEGHAFYVLNFLTGGKTVVYDQTTGLWHERAFYDDQNGVFQAHPATCHALWSGKNYVGGYRNGKLYEYDLGTYTDDGEKIKRVRTTAHHANENKRITYNYIELETERGVGLTQEYMNLYTGSTVLEPGVLPMVILNVSNDGGFTWSDNRYASIGRIGQYKNRCRWTRLGTARDRVFRFSVTDPVKVVLIDGYADMEAEA